MTRENIKRSEKKGDKGDSDNSASQPDPFVAPKSVSEQTRAGKDEQRAAERSAVAEFVPDRTVASRYSCVKCGGLISWTPAFPIASPVESRLASTQAIAPASTPADATTAGSPSPGCAAEGANDVGEGGEEVAKETDSRPPDRGHSTRTTKRALPAAFFENGRQWSQNQKNAAGGLTEAETGEPHRCVHCDPPPARSLVGRVWTLVVLSDGRIARLPIWDQSRRSGSLDLFRDARSPERVVHQPFAGLDAIPTIDAWERGLIDLDVRVLS